MSRLLVLVLALVACADRTAVSSVPDGLDRWLSTWIEARRCLVDEGEDVATGVAVATLKGRVCTKPIHQLQIHVTPVDALHELWRSAIEYLPNLEQMSAPDRAAAIAEIDVRARLLGAFTGFPVPELEFSAPLQVLTALPRYQANTTERDWCDPFMEAMETSSLTFVAAVLDQSSRCLIVRKPEGVAHHAYRIDSTIDRGVTWQVRSGPTASRVVDHWQDPETAEIELMVEGLDGVASIHHIAGAGIPVVKPVFYATPPRMFGGVIECKARGAMWRVDGDIVTRFGARSVLLHGSAREGQAACRGNNIVVLTRGPDTIERCDSILCRWAWTAPPSLRGSVAVLADGRWIYAANIGRVVAIWVEHGTPRFYRVPVGGHIAAIESDERFPVLVVSRGFTSRGESKSKFVLR